MNKNTHLSLCRWLTRLSRCVSYRQRLLVRYLQTPEGLRELGFWTWMAGVAGMAVHTLLAAYAN